MAVNALITKRETLNESSCFIKLNRTHIQRIHTHRRCTYYVSLSPAHTRTQSLSLSIHLQVHITLQFSLLPYYFSCIFFLFLFCFGFVRELITFNNVYLNRLNRASIIIKRVVNIMYTRMYIIYIIYNPHIVYVDEPFKCYLVNMS